MLTRILIFIKHNFPFVWHWIDGLNSFLFRFLHVEQFNKAVAEVMNVNQLEGFEIRRLEQSDISDLERLLNDQPKERLLFFKPHAYDFKSLLRVSKNPSFIMMGVFDGSRLVGYFFLRCFWNKKCFVGRLIDEPYQGKGIGKVMNNIMYNIAWTSGFKCLSTISKNNQMVMRSHAKNNTMKVLKELDNDYLLVEFVKGVKVAKIN